MERYTRREGDRIAVPQERLEEALARLAQLEDMMQDLAAQQEEIPRRLQELRSQGREKTVQFRELLPQKLVIQNLCLLMERYGLRP